MKLKTVIVLGILFGVGWVSLHADDRLSLAGKWRFALDPTDTGINSGWAERTLTDTIALPNSTSTAGKGQPWPLEPKLDETSLDHLHQRFSYVGAAWYQRDFNLPKDWQGKDVLLSLERVLWDSTVWLNGQRVGETDSLCTPHRYDLTPDLQPGRNLLAIRVDNRKKYEIGIGTAYTDETQTIWIA